MKMPDILRTKVLHLSAAGPFSGAGKAALLLHQALLRRSIESRLLFLNDTVKSVNEVFSYSDDALSRLRRLGYTTLDRIPTWFYSKRKKQIFSPGMFGVPLLRHPLVKWADVVHLHWINHGFLRLNELRQLGKPIVWTLHDMWPFTGGCHHSFSCLRYKLSCGSCPVLGSTDENDLSHRVLLHKKGTIPVDRVRWIAISSWMADSARKSSMLKESAVTIVHSGIDVKNFAPKDKLCARKILGLPPDKPIILLGADNILSPYKGVDFSLAALRAVDSNCLVVSFGARALPAGQLPQTVVHMGYVNDPEKLATIYSAADLFLGTSVAEAFGMTMAEAQCCGVPVVAFDSAGPKDIVEHNVTGYLAEMNSIPDLVAGINSCLSQKYNGELIRKRAVDLFSIDNCAIKYCRNYQESLQLA